MFSAEFERTQRKFLNVRNYLMNKSKGDPKSVIAKAYRICYSKPLLFYKERTRKQAVDDLVRESQPTQ